MRSLKSFAAYLRRTPLHPQWLLGPQRPPEGIGQAVGVVLDIGAADKWIAQHLSPDVRYVALDYPATGHELYGAKPNVFSDAARLPFCDEAFNGVICLEVLEHVPDPARVMIEIARVLKPNGCAWISMPFLYPLHDAPFDFQRYTEFGLKRDAQRSCLEIESLTKSGHSIRVAGLLGCLALAGAIQARKGVLTVLLLVLAAPIIFAINIVAFVLSLCWPDWNGLAFGYDLKVHKP